MMYKGGHKTAYNLPERSIKPSKPFDACRVHGSLTLNKVAGNFHITAGKSIHFASGHIHISNMFDENPLNFSHRINRFSFGEATSGIVHPLEGDEKILQESKFKRLRISLSVAQFDGNCYIHFFYSKARYLHNISSKSFQQTFTHLCRT